MAAALLLGGRLPTELLTGFQGETDPPAHTHIHISTNTTAPTWLCVGWRRQASEPHGWQEPEPAQCIAHLTGRGPVCVANRDGKLGGVVPLVVAPLLQSWHQPPASRSLGMQSVADPCRHKCIFSGLDSTLFGWERSTRVKCIFRILSLLSSAEILWPPS